MIDPEKLYVNQESFLRFCKTLNEVEMTIVYLVLSGYRREQIERLGIKKEAIERVLKKAVKWVNAEKKKSKTGKKKWIIL